MSLLPRLLVFALVAALFLGCSSKGEKNDFLASGDRFFQAGQYENAKQEYFKALKLDPKAAGAIRNLGIIYHEQGAPLQALPYLMELRSRNAEDLETSKRKMLSLAALGGFAEARKVALEILEKTPSQPEAMLLLANTSQSKGEIEEAERMLVASPESAPVLIAIATLETRKKNPAAAETSLKRALELDANAPETHLAAGAFYYSEKRIPEADLAFQRAADLAPARSIARIRYAQFKEEIGKVSEAKALLEQICKDAPEYLPAWRIRARLAFAQKELSESQSFVEKILHYDRDDFEARSLLAQIHMARGETAKAIETLKSINAQYPRLPEPAFQLAVACLQANKLDEAEASLKQVIAASPDHAEALVLLAKLNLRKGHAQAVVSSMSGLLAKQPGSVEAQMLLAGAFRALGRLDEALALLRKSEAAETSVEMQTLVGAIHRQKGDLGAARAAFAKAAGLAPNDLRVLNRIVELEVSQKDYAAALRHIDAQLSRTPESASLHLMRAKVHVTQEDWTSAEIAAKRAIELEPDFTGAYELLGNISIAAGKIETGLAQLNTVLEKNPKHAGALMMQALLEEKGGNFAKAQTAYERLIAAHPKSVPGLNNLALLSLEKLNEPEKALGLAMKARELTRDDPVVADTLGWVYFRRGDYPSALTLIRESAEKMPGNREVQYHLGLASYMMGQEEASLAALTEAAKGPANDSMREDIKRHLRALRAEGASNPEHDPAALEKLVAENPRDVISWIRLARAYRQLKAFDKAAAAGESALRINPSLLPAILELASLHAGPLNDPAKALELAKRARALAAEDPAVAGRLGVVAEEAGDLRWSLTLLQECLREAPNNYDALLRFAWVSYRLGDVEVAEKAMQRLSASAPDPLARDEAAQFLATVSLAKDESRLLAAGEDLRRLLESKPGDLPAQFAMANLLALRGEFKEAAAICEKILAKSPDFAPAQKRLAQLCVDHLNQLDRARDLATKAREALPNDRSLAQILATIHFKKEGYEEAMRILKELSRQEPLDAQGLMVLGMCQMHTSQKTESQQTLKRALEMGLKEPFARETKWALQMLESPGDTIPAGGTPNGAEAFPLR